MNKEEYFKIVSVGDNIIHFEMKGFWPDYIADELGRYFVSKIKESVDSLNGQKFFILADWSECRVMTEITKKYLAQAMKYTLENGLIKGIEILPSAIAKLSVKGAATSAADDNEFRMVVDDLDQAYATIESLKMEISA